MRLLSGTLIIAFGVVCLHSVDALPMFGCCRSNQAVHDPSSKRIFKTDTYHSKGRPGNHVVTDSRPTSPRISYYEETIVPTAKGMGFSSSGQSSPIRHVVDAPIQTLRSNRYRLNSLTGLSEKALRNLKVLPDDPFKAEVDYRYGIGTSENLAARRVNQQKARRGVYLEMPHEWNNEMNHRSSTRPVELPRHPQETANESSDEW